MYKLIYAFSSTTREALSKLSDASGEVIDHLIKIFLWPKSDSINHWKQEVYNFLHRVYKLKTTNKYPKKKQILKAIWNAFGDTIRDITPVFIEYMDEPNIEFSYTSLESAIYEYMEWISEVLSKHGIVSRIEVYNKIDELSSKFF